MAGREVESSLKIDGTYDAWRMNVLKQLRQSTDTEGSTLQSSTRACLLRQLNALHEQGKKTANTGGGSLFLLHSGPPSLELQRQLRLAACSDAALSEQVQQAVSCVLEDINLRQSIAVAVAKRWHRLKGTGIGQSEDSSNKNGTSQQPKATVTTTEQKVAPAPSNMGHMAVLTTAQRSRHEYRAALRQVFGTDSLTDTSDTRAEQTVLGTSGRAKHGKKSGKKQGKKRRRPQRGPSSSSSSSSSSSASSR
eukprot:TRINITY_DN7981_c0_g1_i1.p1 TRINITY_DN7981_c0_g1~~TRINITY_DN7981_c0_g1_i1.p1  ORF type:complete len:258 (-),score=41.25 TRINITY_DN7981_c0_g1_i1:7-756(-)